MNVYKTGLRAMAVLVLLIFSVSLQAQTGVGIGVPDPDPSAILDLDDDENKRGVLVPRMTSAQRQAISAPADGLLVYDADQKMFYHYDAGVAGWQAVNPFSYRKGSDATDEDNFVMNAGNNKSFVIGNVPAPAERLEVDGAVKISGDLNVKDISAVNVATTGNIVAGPGGMLEGNGTIPLGGIVIWSGEANAIPVGWALCNGETKDGYKTPDLRQRFVIGYGTTGSYTQPGNLSSKGTITGSVGGEEKVTLTVNQIPSHNHTASTSSSGGHAHTLNRRGGNDFLIDADAASETYRDGADGSTDDDVITVQGVGDHTHTSVPINFRGGNGAHENRPPYYVLAFIMRVK